jgi:hypothetical protein
VKKETRYFGKRNTHKCMPAFYFSEHLWKIFRVRNPSDYLKRTGGSQKKEPAVYKRLFD